MADAIFDDGSPSKEANHGLTYLQRVRDEFIISMGNLQEAANHASESAVEYFDSMNMAHSVALKTPSSSIVKALSKRQKRDPKQPKRPMNAYHLFCAAGRDIVKSDLGEECLARDVVMELRSRWSKLPEDEKAAWYEIYDQNKLIYLEKLKQFQSSDQHSEAEARITFPAIDFSDCFQARSDSEGENLENDGIMSRSISPDQLKVQGAPVLPARISVASLLGEDAVVGRSNFVVQIPAKEAIGTFVRSGVPSPVPAPYRKAGDAKAAKNTALSEIVFYDGNASKAKSAAMPVVLKRKFQGF